MGGRRIEPAMTTDFDQRQLRTSIRRSSQRIRGSAGRKRPTVRSVVLNNSRLGTRRGRDDARVAPSTKLTEDKTLVTENGDASTSRGQDLRNAADKVGKRKRRSSPLHATDDKKEARRKSVCLDQEAEEDGVDKKPKGREVMLSDILVCDSDEDDDVILIPTGDNEDQHQEDGVGNLMRSIDIPTDSGSDPAAATPTTRLSIRSRRVNIFEPLPVIRREDEDEESGPSTPSRVVIDPMTPTPDTVLAERMKSLTEDIKTPTYTLVPPPEKGGSGSFKAPKKSLITYADRPSYAAYDADAKDLLWLQVVQESTNLSEDQFEKMIEIFEELAFNEDMQGVRELSFAAPLNALETPAEWLRQRKRQEIEDAEAMAEKEKQDKCKAERQRMGCDVCRQPAAEDGLMCSRCALVVHGNCYGIPYQLDKDLEWICERCEFKDVEIACLLCGGDSGALKPTVDGRWVHLTCARAFSTVIIRSPHIRMVDGISLISPEDFGLECSICQQSTGACVTCSVSGCNDTFHGYCLAKHSTDPNPWTQVGDASSPKCPKHGQNPLDVTRKRRGGRRRHQQSMESDIVCCICYKGESRDGNLILICDGCDVGVHQLCYGEVTLPEGDWLCARCESGAQAVACIHCPTRDGAFIRSEDGQWAHVLCRAVLDECSPWYDESQTLSRDTQTSPVKRLAKAPRMGKNGVGAGGKERDRCQVCRTSLGTKIACSSQVKPSATAPTASCASRPVSASVSSVAVGADEQDGCPNLYHPSCAQLVGSLSPFAQVICDLHALTVKKLPCYLYKGMVLTETDVATVLPLPNAISAIRENVELGSMSASSIAAVYHYWLAKRVTAPDDGPLLPHFRVALLEKSGRGGKRRRGRVRDRRQNDWEKMRMLRFDLERARLLADMVLKRERLKRARLHIMRDCFDKMCEELPQARNHKQNEKKGCSLL